MFQRPDVIREPLYVIAAVFNPIRYRSRWSLYKKFEKHIEDSGAILYTVECAFGNREFCITDPLNPRHIRLRSPHELWFKENMVNIGISRLPSDWKYVAWIDADIKFARPDWVGETLQQLQHYQFVQMFSEAQDLGPNYEPFMRHKSFIYSYKNKIPRPKGPGYYYGIEGPTPFVTWHPGFAWAARREAIDAVGGLIDYAPLGAADNHMAKGLVGDISNSVHPNVSKAYKNMLLEWERRATIRIRKNVGYVEGLLLHNWHGPKSDRKYWDRWKPLVDFQFNPQLDLKRDAQGLWQLTDRMEPRSIALRDGIRHYFRQRNEDSIYLPDTDIRM
jgi:hypothetical protein